MPTLPNQRHEAFAQALAGGTSASEAYRRAGYRPDRAAASRLSAKVYIKTRVSELQGITAERVVVDRQWVLARLIESAQKNQETNPAASNKALELIGKELGMFVERSENVNHNYNISDEPLSEDAWSERYASEH